MRRTADSGYVCAVRVSDLGYAAELSRCKSFMDKQVEQSKSLYRMLKKTWEANT